MCGCGERAVRLDKVIEERPIVKKLTPRIVKNHIKKVATIYRSNPNPTKK